jgi:hypothetical protein
MTSDECQRRAEEAKALAAETQDLGSAKPICGSLHSGIYWQGIEP